MPSTIINTYGSFNNTKPLLMLATLFFVDFDKRFEKKAIDFGLTPATPLTLTKFVD
jgi:hypothetical protein